MDNKKKFRFPVIERVELKHFSLYTSTNHITLDMKNGVHCLAGANGLGKSTFINILNYGLTGVIRKPNSSLSTSGSIQAYYNDNKSFAKEYFDKRIDENLRDTASITLIFSVLDTRFTIKRGFFEQETLRELRIEKDGEVLDDSINRYTDLHELYAKKLTESIGLEDFEQFVFLQLFVFTFDESHQLIFWDEKLMERVMHLIFGDAPELAKKADQLSKEIQATGSNIRNLQWDATQQQKEITKLLNIIGDSEGKSSKINEHEIEDYSRLTEELASVTDEMQRLQSEIGECLLQITDSSLQVTLLKDEYETLFEQEFDRTGSVEKDANVIKILNRIKINVCKNEDTHANVRELTEYIKLYKCINIYSKDEDQRMTNLRALDEKIFSVNSIQADHLARKKRLTLEYEHFRDKAQDLTKKIREVEIKNNFFGSISLMSKGGPDLGLKIDQLKYTMSFSLSEKENEMKRRDELKAQLRNIEKNLLKKYLEGQENFLPIFINYARNFLGIEINVRMKLYANGPTLVIEVNGSERREKYQLSESQRYFVDIALRMALIEYTSQKALLLVDTPEGSLDIAYESKAGKMFADFVGKGYNLFLTANINTSMLLHSLARICKKEKMQLERMTEWTTLSQVQLEEYERIDEAYRSIEQEMI